MIMMMIDEIDDDLYMFVLVLRECAATVSFIITCSLRSVDFHVCSDYNIIVDFSVYNFSHFRGLLDF